MALTVDQFWVWYWITYDWITFDVYWKMFDPDIPTFPEPYNNVSIYNETYNIDVSWFQCWNEVCCCLMELSNHWDTWDYWTILVTFQQRDGSDWINWWNTFLWRTSIEPWHTKSWYVWVWIDPDEIWGDYTQYRFKWEVSWQTYYKIFNIYWFNYDTTLYDAGKMWIDWVNLCYTDSFQWLHWHIHKVAPDSWYSWGNVGSDYAGHIWIPNSSSDHHIYYIDEFWTKRRTNESRQWEQNNNRYVWSQYKWKVRIPRKNYVSTDPVWYSYLVYVDWAWYVRKQGNWDVY